MGSIAVKCRTSTVRRHGEAGDGNLSRINQTVKLENTNLVERDHGAQR